MDSTADDSVQFDCGGSTLSTRNLLSDLAECIFPAACFITDETSLALLKPCVMEASRIKDAEGTRNRWIDFDQDYSATCEAVHNKRRQDDESKGFLSDMPKARYLHLGRYTVDENDKMMKHSSEIVPVEQLARFTKTWKEEQEQDAVGGKCMCQKFYDHCLAKTTFTKEFLDVFLLTCGTKKPPAKKKAKRSLEMQPTGGNTTTESLANTTSISVANSDGTVNATTNNNNHASYRNSHNTQIFVSSPVSLGPVDPQFVIRAGHQMELLLFLQRKCQLLEQFIRNKGDTPPDFPIPEHLAYMVPTERTYVHQNQENENIRSPPNSFRAGLSVDGTGASFPLSEPPSGAIDYSNVLDSDRTGSQGSGSAARPDPPGNR